MKKNRWQLVLAAAAGLGLAQVANAQFRTGTDGRVREVNNRIGSAGYNDAVGGQPSITAGNFNNAIVTGDITGGRDFRGSVGYTNPTAFRGNLAGSNVDNFIRQSTGAPYGGVQQNNSQVVQPFYGASNGVPPPPGYAPQAPGTGGFVPTPTITRGPGDLRLGQPLSTPLMLTPRPGQFLMPGPVDPSTQTNTFISASPLYGIKTLNPADKSDQAFMQSTLGAGNLSPTQMNASSIQKMREELIQASQTQGPLNQDAANPQALNKPISPNGDKTDLNGQMQKPFETPDNSPLNSNSPLNNGGADNSSNSTGGTEGGNGAISTSLRTGSGVQQRLLSAPRVESAQHTELEKRLAQYRAAQPSDDMAAATEFNRSRREAAARAARGGQQGAAAGGMATSGNRAPGMNTSGMNNPPNALPQPNPQRIGVTPGPVTANPVTPNPVAPAPSDGTPNVASGGATAVAPPPPLKIASLAEGVQGKALSDLLKEAETLMRDGKYNSALEQYDMAEQVAPNSPLIMLGRADVELGRTYYARAEANIRQAFTQDNALLMGQYDLRNLLGQDRLEVIVRDLRSVAGREQTESRPLFLLAYVAYNSGNERMASAYLDLAEKRAGGNDQFFKLVRKYWTLPKNDEPVDLNK